MSFKREERIAFLFFFLSYINYQKNKGDALKYLREEANNMYEICCSYYKKERHLENMDDAVMLSFNYLGENTAYITDCDDKVWTWEIIEA